MSKSRQRVYAYVKPDRFVIENMENASVWVASTDVTDIATSATHREGSLAISFDKDGTTEAFGMISKTLDTERQLNLVDYLHGKLRGWISLSSLADIASVDLIIGESASHNYVYRALDASLKTGFNELSFDIDSPTSTTGNGAAWSSIGYIAIRVNFDAAGDTLTGIIVDSISIQGSLETNLKKDDPGEGKEFVLSGLQTDYDVVAQQSMFAVPRTRTEILSDKACIIKVNTTSSPPMTINLKANEEKIILTTVTNLYLTATDATVRIIAYA